MTMNEEDDAKVIAAMHEMYELRGKVTTGYAQVEFFMADVGQKAARLPEYDHLEDLWAHRLTGRLSAFIRLLERPGRLQKYAVRGRDLAARFPQHERARHFLVHGMTTFEVHRASGSWTAMMRRYEVVDGAPNMRLWRTDRSSLIGIADSISKLATEFVVFCGQMYSDEGLELPTV